ncbi:MAG: RecX family transcriptional regulator [Chitinophagaceae bacterium]|jgi:regulatory protein|nr:RecX family transcriptional regulator [Chitinophagaceae bacterium]
MAYRKTYTPAQALQKARHFCAYQERSHAQVKEKLYAWGLRKNEVDEALSSLIEDQYLNEERFAVAFAGGKFRMKQWGRVKIRHELERQQVGSYNIRKALECIDEADYQRTLDRLAGKKWGSVRGAGITSLTRKAKTRAYLLQKGYESPRISAVLAKLGEEKP